MVHSSSFISIKSPLFDNVITSEKKCYWKRAKEIHQFRVLQL